MQFRHSPHPHTRTQLLRDSEGEGGVSGAALRGLGQQQRGGGGDRTRALNSFSVPLLASVEIASERASLAAAAALRVRAGGLCAPLAADSRGRKVLGRADAESYRGRALRMVSRRRRRLVLPDPDPIAHLTARIGRPGMPTPACARCT
jgi:hypothetical protein